MKKILFLFLGCFISSIIFANLGKYEGWDKTWVQHLLTKKELKVFKKLSTESEAENFVALFWAKRDPTPGTPRNEFKERCEMLASIADKDYSNEKVKGSITDRGKVLLLLGPPYARKEVAYSDSEGNLQNEGVSMTADQRAFMFGKMDVWIYRKEQIERLPFELPWNELRVEFKKEEGQKDFYLNRNISNVLKAIAQAQEGWIKSPDLKNVPDWAKTMGKSPFIILAEKILKGEELLIKDTALTTYGTFYDSNNQTYGSVIILFDENSPVKDQKEVNFFLEVLDKNNNVTAGPIEDKVALKQTIRGFYLDRSFLIESGDYKLLKIVGKEDGTAIYSNLIDINVPDFKDLNQEGFWFCLASDVKPVDSVWYENDPFVFGGVKVIPKLDLKFKKEDDLWYFYNLFHPEIDEQLQKPKISEKIEIYKDGRIFRQSKESESELTVLSEGRYASGKAFNIGQDLRLEPAKYKFKLIIKDLISNKKFEKEIEFKVE